MSETQKKPLTVVWRQTLKDSKKIFYTRNSSTIIENLVERVIKLRGN